MSRDIQRKVSSDFFWHSDLFFKGNLTVKNNIGNKVSVKVFVTPTFHIPNICLLYHVLVFKSILFYLYCFFCVKCLMILLVCLLFLFQTDHAMHRRSSISVSWLCCKHSLSSNGQDLCGHALCKSLHWEDRFSLCFLLTRDGLRVFKITHARSRQEADIAHG